METQLGPSLRNLNLLAYMALKFGDALVADTAFSRLGDNWDKETWRTQAYYESQKESATLALSFKPNRPSLEDAADRNMQTADGPCYQTTFRERLAKLVEQCTQFLPNDHSKFEMLLRVGKEGRVERIEMDPYTDVSGCLFGKLKGGDSPVSFPPPPRPL